MKRQAGFLYIFLGTVLLIFLNQEAASQPDSLSASKSDSSTSRHTLYSAAGYGSNMIYLGSTISENEPYGFAALAYGFKSSLFLTLSAFHLANHDPFTAFYTGSINYSHTFNSWFDISVSASRYQVAPSLRETLFNNFFYSDLTVGIDWRLLYSKISAGWLYTGESSMYYQFRNSRFFTTPSFFKKKVNISFDPYVNILFGTLSTIETNTDTITGVNYPFFPPKTGQGSGNGNGAGQGNGSGTSTGSGTPTQSVTNTTLSTKFGIMEIDFGIPVSLNADRFTIEVEPGYALPLYDEDYYPGTKGFLFTVSCYFKLF